MCAWALGNAQIEHAHALTWAHTKQLGTTELMRRQDFLTEWQWGASQAKLTTWRRSCFIDSNEQGTNLFAHNFNPKLVSFHIS